MVLRNNPLKNNPLYLSTLKFLDEEINRATLLTSILFSEETSSDKVKSTTPYLNNLQNCWYAIQEYFLIKGFTNDEKDFDTPDVLDDLRTELTLINQQYLQVSIIRRNHSQVSELLDEGLLANIRLYQQLSWRKSEHNSFVPAVRAQFGSKTMYSALIGQIAEAQIYFLELYNKDGPSVLGKSLIKGYVQAREESLEKIFG